MGRNRRGGRRRRAGFDMPVCSRSRSRAPPLGQAQLNELPGQKRLETALCSLLVSIEKHRAAIHWVRARCRHGWRAIAGPLGYPYPLRLRRPSHGAVRATMTVFECQLSMYTGMFLVLKGQSGSPRVPGCGFSPIIPDGKDWTMVDDSNYMNMKPEQTSQIVPT